MDKKNESIYRRVLVKLSGEALQGDHLFGIDPSKLSRIAQEIFYAVEVGAQVAIVIGGGNLIRGADLNAAGLDRITGDQMGMLATVINGLALRDAIEKKGMPTVLMSAFEVASIAEQYERYCARDRLQKGHVVILAAGTGNPLVTTDSAAALRGIEMDVDIILKATKVDGVYDRDPIKYPTAERYQSLDYCEVIDKRLGVMDLTAILLCQDQSLPIRVFNMNKQGALKRIVLGEDVGTLISSSR